MDRLTIFLNPVSEVKLTSENSLDNVVEKLTDIEKEAKLTRKGNEAFIYGEDLEESDEIDMEEIEDG